MHFRIVRNRPDHKEAAGALSARGVQTAVSLVTTKFKHSSLSHPLKRSVKRVDRPFSMAFSGSNHMSIQVAVSDMYA